MPSEEFVNSYGNQSGEDKSNINVTNKDFHDINKQNLQTYSVHLSDNDNNLTTRSKQSLSEDRLLRKNAIGKSQILKKRKSLTSFEINSVFYNENNDSILNNNNIKSSAATIPIKRRQSQKSIESDPGNFRLPDYKDYDDDNDEIKMASNYQALDKEKQQPNNNNNCDVFVDEDKKQHEISNEQNVKTTSTNTMSSLSKKTFKRPPPPDIPVVVKFSINKSSIHHNVGSSATEEDDENNQLLNKSTSTSPSCSILLNQNEKKSTTNFCNEKLQPSPPPICNLKKQPQSEFSSSQSCSNLTQDSFATYSPSLINNDNYNNNSSKIGVKIKPPLPPLPITINSTTLGPNVVFAKTTKFPPDICSNNLGTSSAFEVLLPSLSVATRTLLNTSGIYAITSPSCSINNTNFGTISCPNTFKSSSITVIPSHTTTTFTNASIPPHLLFPPPPPVMISIAGTGGGSVSYTTNMVSPGLLLSPSMSTILSLPGPTGTGGTADKKYRKTFWEVLAPTYKSKNEDFKKLFFNSISGGNGNSNSNSNNIPDVVTAVDVSAAPSPTAMISPGPVSPSPSGESNFNMAATERLIVDYSCALQKEILIQGRMYVSQSWLCFYANIFKWESKIKIRFKDIVSINKEKLAKIIPNALTIITRGGLKYTFASFTSRDKAYLMLFKVWQNALMDQIPIPNSEIWQLVHESYGSELGITSDDEDYMGCLPNSKGLIGSDSLSDSLLYHEGGRVTNTHLLHRNHSIIQGEEATPLFLMGGDGSCPDLSQEDDLVLSLSRRDQAATLRTAGISRMRLRGTNDFSPSQKDYNAEYLPEALGVEEDEVLHPMTAVPLTKICSESLSGHESGRREIQQRRTRTTSEATSLVNVATTEDEDTGKDQGAISCLCPQHPGKLYLDLIINKSCDEVFQLLFTNSKFFRDAQKERNTKSLVMSEWKSSNENLTGAHHSTMHLPNKDKNKEKFSNHRVSGMLKKRVLSYVVEISGPLGTKSAPTTEKQTLLIGGEGGTKKSRRMKSKKRYVVECEVTNSGVPYSDAYYVICRYCLTRASSTAVATDLKSCRLAVHCLIGYKKSVFSLVKNIIEKNCQSGLQEYFKFLGNKLIQELRAKSISTDFLADENELEEDQSTTFNSLDAGDGTSNDALIKKSHSRKSSVSFLHSKTDQHFANDIDENFQSTTAAINEDKHMKKDRKGLSFSPTYVPSPSRETSSLNAFINLNLGTKFIIALPYLLLIMGFFYACYLRYSLLIIEKKLDYLFLHTQSPNNITSTTDCVHLWPSPQSSTNYLTFKTFLVGKTTSCNNNSRWIDFDQFNLIQNFQALAAIPFTFVSNFVKKTCSFLPYFPTFDGWFQIRRSISEKEFNQGLILFTQLLKQMENSIMTLQRTFNDTHNQNNTTL